MDEPRMDPEAARARAAEVAGDLLARMGLSLRVDARVSGDQVILDLVGEDSALIIGRQGQTLDAFQFLVARLVYRGGGERGPLIVADADGYRERRREALVAMAERLGDKARSERRPVAVEGLSAAERRVVHNAVAALGGLTTRSEGEEPYRRLLITPSGSGQGAGADEAEE